jgi:hypothetical protein
MELNELHETLLNMRGNSLTDALFILVDHMVEAGDGDISYSDGNIGILVNKNVVEIVDIEAARSIAQFALTGDKVTI